MISNLGKSLFTSESVTEGHPDKICDQISDAVLDAILFNDANGRVACEVMVSKGLVVVSGEITTKANIDIPEIVRKTIRDIGYTKEEYGLDANTCEIILSIDKQSLDISHGITKKAHLNDEAPLENIQSEIICAGDQGLMFGFAVNETPELMPLPISLAHELSRELTRVRKNKIIDYLRPDGKTQVTVEYDNNQKPIRVDTIVISTQHHPKVSLERVKKDVMTKVIKPIVPENLIDKNTKYLINPAGRFVTGGPEGDAGLTGRKIIVDTYGGYARHGGGAFSGKDSTKVDRSASYAARYVAKNIVASGLAEKCEVQLAYAIGVTKPISIRIETFGTGVISDEILVGIVHNHLDLSPDGIIKKFNLKSPIFKQTASYGHFGRSDLDLPWEKTDMEDVLAEFIPKTYVTQNS